MSRSDDSSSAVVAEAGARLRGTALLLTGDRRHAAALVTSALAATRRQWHRRDPAAAVPAARCALVRTVLAGAVPETTRRLGDDLADDDRAYAVLVHPDVGSSGLTEADLGWLAALAGLPVRARVALVLRLHDGLSAEETAGLLDTDAATVRGLVGAALRDVGPLLDDDDAVRPTAAVPPPAPAPDGPDDDDPGDDPYAIYRRPR